VRRRYPQAVVRPHPACVRRSRPRARTRVVKAPRRGHRTRDRDVTIPCVRRFVSFSHDLQYANLGFRCCRDPSGDCQSFAKFATYRSFTCDGRQRAHGLGRPSDSAPCVPVTRPSSRLPFR
jgi:hypothetical protein